MRADYNTLIWDVQGSIEFDGLLRSFIEGRCDGIYLRVQRGVEIDDLDFLAELPDLKYVEVNGAVRDDSRAFSLPDVVELILLTRSRIPVPETVSDALESLGVDDRPGTLDLSGLARLRALTLWSFARPDLRFLSGAPNLEWLKLEGLGSAVDLRGIEGCRSLVEAELLELQVESLEPLRSLQNVVRLWLIGPQERQTSEPLSLADLSGLRALRELRIINSGAVQTAEPLLAMPALQDVRLRGTRVLDGSVEALQALSQRARVVGP